jgi:two-component system sensor histidine kinase RegB
MSADRVGEANRLLPLQRDAARQGLVSAIRLRLARGLGALAALLRSDQGRVRLHTLAVARWVAVVGQLFTVLLVHFSLDIKLQLAALLPAILLSAVVNLVLGLGFKAATRLSDTSASILFAFDALQLSYLLALTGGVQNPFVVLLILPVAVAASMLGRNWTAAITGLTLVCISALALVPGELPWRIETLTLPPLYLAAAWAALSMTTVLTAAYAWSIAEETRRRATALSATQLALAREQELSALGGQAAAAAHLLGSPLATINIVAKELVRELPEGSPLAEDAQVLLAQARRCREILQTLGRRADDDGHARFIRAPLSTLLDAIAQEFARPDTTVKVQVEAVDDSDEPEVVPTPELRHSLANLIDNAIRFAERTVTITVRPSRAGLAVVIDDDGPGFPAEVLDWLGEPYLSTRSEEGGLGLGIFIAITLLARTGAKLHVDNKMKGARVTLSWPPQALERALEEIAHERRGH